MIIHTSHASGSSPCPPSHLELFSGRGRSRAGFRHSAFTFGAESSVAKSNINGAKIPPGQLINFVQKGIMYAELERSVSEEGADLTSSEPFSLRRPNESSDGKSSGGPPAKKQHTGDGPSGSDGSANHSASNGKSLQQQSSETSQEQVTTLEGHENEVFICAWNPRNGLLASGSGDSTARIWRVPEGSSKEKEKPAVLQHFSNEKEKSKDVTTLDWNPSGSLLATGSYDGRARIWSASGKLTNTLVQHKGPIFSLKWNSTGRYLLSGSVDKTAIIWDAQSGDVKQQVARPPRCHAALQPPLLAPPAIALTHAPLACFAPRSLPSTRRLRLTWTGATRTRLRAARQIVRSTCASSVPRITSRNSRATATR